MKKNIFSIIIAGVLFCLLQIVSCYRGPMFNQVVQIKGDYICISLSNYFLEVNKLLQAGKAVPEELDSLFGMSWLDGYVIDTERNDIILVGKSIKSRPTYHLEDIIVNYQNVFDSANSPYCSLDPYPENVLNLHRCMNNQTTDFETTVKNCQEAIGGQKIIVGGVPRNSRHAKIMIFADYDMKKLSQGLLKAPGIRSCIDFAMHDTTVSVEGKEQGSTMSRFWFHIKKDEEGYVYPNYIESEGVVMINECPVVVLTEKQVADSSGNLEDKSEEEDPNAESFAAEMSNKFTGLANKSEIFAELENLFRLQACFRAMQIKNAVEISKIDLACISGFSLKPGINDLPESLPGLINYKVTEKKSRIEGGVSTQQHLYLVAGGVSQEMTISELNLLYDEYLEQAQTVILVARPKKESVAWNVKIPGAE